jgi:acetyl-CoA acetyltransferase
MSTAYIAGGAMIRMGKYPAASYPALAAPSIKGALQDAGVATSDVQSVVCGHSAGGSLVAQRICKEFGFNGVEMINVENACSGGATALHIAVEQIRSGQYDVVLVVGLEKLTSLGRGSLPMLDEDPEAQLGLIMPAVYAMRAQRFLFERDATPRDLALVSVQSRRHGAANPYAQFQSEVTVDEVLASRPIADPLTLLECCPSNDGSAAVVVVSESARRRLRQPMMKVEASMLHSGTYVPGARSLLSPSISVECAREAYEEAGFGPEDLDVVELHDAFAISQLIYYEALGLCEQGDAASFHRAGGATYGGDVVVGPSGGLLSRGHPVGASGVAQVVEMLWHLSGRAGKRQVEKARAGMTHVTGGGISGFDHGACAIHLFTAC